MKRFLRVLGNLGIMILAFVVYSGLEILFVRAGRMKLNFLSAFILALISAGVIWLLFFVYKHQLKQENDWFFNAKPHWNIHRILFALGMFFLLMVWQVSFVRLFGGNQTSANQAELEEIRRQSSSIFNILLVVIAPFCEEIIFRGMFINTFFPVESKTNKWLAVITSGFVFAYLHDPSFTKFIYLYWIMGCILAWTYVSTKDLRYSILVHLLNNLIGVL